MGLFGEVAGRIRLSCFFGDLWLVFGREGLGEAGGREDGFLGKEGCNMAGCGGVGLVGGWR